MDPETHKLIVKQGLPLKGTTDEKGKVSFPDTELRSAFTRGQDGTDGERSKDPRQFMSKPLDVQIIYAGGGIQCSTGAFSLDEILRTGVIGENRCNKKFDPTQFKSTPGEVVIFIGKYHWWEAGQT
jgi:hypothetical protein